MTARRILFFLIYGILLVFCLATGSPLLYFAFFVMTGMLFLSLFSLLLVRLRFSLKQEVTPLETESGNKGSLSIFLNNPYLFFFPQLEAEYLLPGPEGGTEYIANFTVLPFQRIRIHEDLDLPCRGIYRVGLQRITFYDMFGLFRLNLPFGHRPENRVQPLVVLPRIHALSQVMLSEMESPTNTSGAAKATEDTSSPSDPKTYHSGDPIKRIHWKLSARQSRLMIKTYEPAAVGDTLIYLDTDTPTGSSSEVWYLGEVMTSTAVSLASAILQTGVPVRIIYLAGRRFERRLTDLSEIHLLQKEMSSLNFSEKESLLRLLIRESGSLSASRCAYVLTSRLTGASVDLFSTLSQSGIKLAVGLCRGTEEEADRETVSLMEELEHKEIRIAELLPTENPPSALEAVL